MLKYKIIFHINIIIFKIIHVAINLYFKSYSKLKLNYKKRMNSSNGLLNQQYFLDQRKKVNFQII
jgi:hypothetical protein